jgi:hypothetical protein
MDLTNFILLAVERNMISNKYGLDLFYTVFKEASSNQQGQTVTNEHGEEVPLSTSVLINHNFFLSLTMLAQTLHAHSSNPFESMFEQMLVDKIKTHNQTMVGGRQPKMEDETLEILSEEAIRVYLTYYE